MPQLQWESNRRGFVQLIDWLKSGQPGGPFCFPLLFGPSALLRPAIRARASTLRVRLLPGRRLNACPPDSTPTLPPTPNPNPVSAPTCSSTAPPSSNKSSGKGRPVPPAPAGRGACRGGTAPPQPGPRTSTGPPLGNRQPQP